MLKVLVMSIETTRVQSLRVFDENITPHILGDLKILDGIQSETHGNSCAVPTAMLILSSLDFIGFLLREKGNSDETEINISTAIQHRNFFPPIYTKNVIKDLVIFYRHGMMHTFYPRQTSSKIYGIHKSPGKDLMELETIEGHQINSLNVNVLSEDFKNYIQSLYSELKTTADEKLLQNILNGFKRVYPENLTTSSSTTTQTTIPYGVNMQK
jgi:hypothetical protein